jgi:hypothetical protein
MLVQYILALVFALFALCWPNACLAEIRKINRSVETSVKLNIKDYLSPDAEICMRKGAKILLTAVEGDQYVFRVTDKNPIGCDKEKAIDADRLYSVLIDKLDGSSSSYKELAAGALVVPFKYYYAGDGAFAGNSSVGGYMGVRYNNAFWGLTATPIVFVGASTIAVPKNESEAQTLSGFSWGIGLIGTIGPGFQAGVVIGWDRVSRSAKWVNNGKQWLAVEIGFDFAK